MRKTRSQARAPKLSGQRGQYPGRYSRYGSNLSWVVARVNAVAARIAAVGAAHHDHGVANPNAEQKLRLAVAGTGNLGLTPSFKIGSNATPGVSKDHPEFLGLIEVHVVAYNIPAYRCRHRPIRVRGAEPIR